MPSKEPDYRWRVKYFRWERILLMAETITFPFATEEYRGRDLFYLFRYPGNVTRDGEKSREKPFHREGVICVCLGHVTVAISKWNAKGTNCKNNCSVYFVPLPPPLPILKTGSLQKYCLLFVAGTRDVGWVRGEGSMFFSRN